jgi:hypothetical protein
MVVRSNQREVMMAASLQEVYLKLKYEYKKLEVETCLEASGCRS